MAKNKVKVPKTVAGWKVPKGLRKSGVAHLFLGNDLGRAILADMLIAAAGAAAAAIVRHRPAGAQVAYAGEAALDSGQRAVAGTADAVQVAAGALGSVVTEAVRSIFPSDGTSRKSKSRKKERKPLKASAGAPKVKRMKKRNQGQHAH